MPKFSSLAIEQPPIRKVPFRLANSGDECEVGIQVLPASARLEAIEASRRLSAKQGVEKWDDHDPTCSLEFYIEILARAVVTAESAPDAVELFFDSADQVRNDRRIGQENITYLYEVFEQHESEYSVRPTKMTIAEAIAMCYNLANQDEDEGARFLDRLGPAMLKSCTLFLVNLLFSLPVDNSLLESAGLSRPSTSSPST